VTIARGKVLNSYRLLGPPMRIALLVALCSVSAITCARAAELEQQPVFEAGKDGYHTYRIPAAMVSPKGTLLAFCEGRKVGRGDAGDIDLVLKRSFDGGRTWRAMQLVWDDDANTCGNPCPVVDRSTGTIWLLLTHNLGSDKEAAIVDGTSRGSRTVWLSKSTDDGATWAKPVEITRDVKRTDWTWYATGPGVGIQLRNGRLVIPCDNKVAGTKVRQSHVIYSDEHGATWKHGGVVGPNCNECQVVELSDGRLMLNMRSYQANHRRLVATSKDGGLTWTEPREVATLIEPVCQASIVRYFSAGSDKGRAAGKDKEGMPFGPLLFSNPASTKREKLTIRVSRDEGRTWPTQCLLHAGPAAYSCLTVLSDGMIGCLYERGEKHPYENITFARFPLSWLEARDAE
jgi:sialidase-1